MKNISTTTKTPVYYQSSQILKGRRKDNASQPVKPGDKKRCYLFHRLLYVPILIFLLLPAVVKANSKKPHELVVGVRIDAPPFSFCAEESITDDKKISCPEVSEDTDVDPDVNSDPGRKYQGYTVDLCKRIITRAVKEEGLYCSVRYKELTSADRFEFLKNNEIDMLCGATTVTLERLRVADFSLFTFLSGASLMYAQSASNKENGQKNSLNVGVLQKTTTREQVRDIISNLQQQEDYFKPIILQNVEITPYSNHYAGLYGLLDGEIDAYIADREILLALKTKGEQILEARNTVKQSIWYVIFNDNVDSDNLDELDFGVLDTIADDQATQIINDLTQHDGGEHQTGADEAPKYANYRDGLKALDNKEIQAFIGDSGIFTAFQKREENSLEAQAENKPMKYTVDMKIIIVTDKEEDPDDNQGYGETNETDVKLIVLRDYFTVEPYAIGIRLGATDLRYVADKVLNEMFAWNKESGASEIYTILQRSFPGKKFSKSIENMFRLQRVSVGTRVADEFLPRIPRAKCKALESSSDAADKAQPATSP